MKELKDILLFDMPSLATAAAHAGCHIIAKTMGGEKIDPHLWFSAGHPFAADAETAVQQLGAYVASRSAVIPEQLWRKAAELELHGLDAGSFFSQENWVQVCFGHFAATLQSGHQVLDLAQRDARLLEDQKNAQALRKQQEEDDKAAEAAKNAEDKADQERRAKLQADEDARAAKAEEDRVKAEDRARQQQEDDALLDELQAEEQAKADAAATAVQDTEQNAASAPSPAADADAPVVEGNAAADPSTTPDAAAGEGASDPAAASPATE